MQSESVCFFVPLSSRGPLVKALLLENTAGEVEFTIRMGKSASRELLSLTDANASVIALRSDHPPPLLNLTKRENQVLGLLGHGLDNKSIASKLYISESTVKTHVRNILAKLNLKSRTEAAVYSAQNQFDKNI